MFLKNKISRFHLIFTVLVVLKEAQSDDVFSFIFADDTFVSDDICSNIINEHRCVKNVLGVLVDHINNNLQKITEIEYRTKLNEENIKNKEQKINMLETELKVVSAQNKKLKIKLNKLGLKYRPTDFSSFTNLLNLFHEKYGPPYGVNKMIKDTKMDNVTMVRI